MIEVAGIGRHSALLRALAASSGHELQRLLTLGLVDETDLRLDISAFTAVCNAVSIAVDNHGGADQHA